MAKVLRMSPSGLEFLEKEEGCILKVYKDQAGKETIGIGHLLTKKEKEEGIIKLGNKKSLDITRPILRSEAFELLAKDLRDREEELNILIKVQLDQEQFDALLSFVFNIGMNAFATSTLLKELNKSHYEVVPKEMKKWERITIAGKKGISLDLRNRRKREVRLWLERKY